MEQKIILEEWLERKLSFKDCWTLSNSCISEYEYKGRIGHPSSYAFVRFECQPAKNLGFDSTVLWSNHIPSDWISLHETSILEAIVDGLLCVSTTPYLGCSLTLVDIKYDEVSSSPTAFYRATKEAIAELIRVNRWNMLSFYKK